MSESKKKITICTPAKGGIPWYFLRPLTQVLTAPHPKYEFNFLVEAGNNAIGISRNIIADNVINDPQNIWKLVQIDSDAFWTPEQLYRLVDHEEEFVAAPYVRKHSGPVSWLCVRTPGTEILPSELMQCDFLGTHFFSFNVDALRKMRDFYPERAFTYDEVDGEFRNKKMCELFPIGIVGPNTPEGRLARIEKVLSAPTEGTAIEYFSKFYTSVKEIIEKPHSGESRMLGEDYGFCRLARKAGFKLWCDRGTNPIGHVGDIVYPVGDTQLSKATEFPFSHESMKDLVNY